MRVLEVFDSLQGEGVWAGVAMTFVRFAGCNAADAGLECVRWCDTQDSWDQSAGEESGAPELAARILERSPRRVCLTGGEPLLQGEELVVLTHTLRAAGVVVHLETNGTMPVPPGAEFDWVAVSPKPPRPSIAPGLRADEVKLVVEPGFDVRVAERLADENPEAVICLQPEASRLADVVSDAVAAVSSHPGWRLSLQLHKVLGIP